MVILVEEVAVSLKSVGTPFGTVKKGNMESNFNMLVAGLKNGCGCL